jgi:hypothetical protein
MHTTLRLAALSLLFTFFGCGGGSDIPEQPDASQLAVQCSDSNLYSDTHKTCAAMDAQGQGTCNCGSLGFAWDGAKCVQLGSGFCSCVGADCDKLTRTEQECLTNHASCEKPKITGCNSASLYQSADGACAAMDVQFQDVCNCGPMGWIWNGTACVQPNDSYCTCVGADCGKLTRTEQECLTNHAACAKPKITGCRNVALYQNAHVACAAMDVQFQDLCNCAPGEQWFWNGTACVLPLDGVDTYCTCIGADCDKLAHTEQECQTSHAACQ